MYSLITCPALVFDKAFYTRIFIDFIKLNILRLLSIHKKNLRVVGMHL